MAIPPGKSELGRLGIMVFFWRIPYADIPDGESLIEGGFVYAVENRPLSAAYAQTGAYVDENRKLDARYCVNGFHEFSDTDASAPTVQLQIIMVVLAVIAYRKWDFRVMDVSRAFPRSEPLGGYVCEVT